MPVAMFLRVIATWGTTPPDWSVTVPESVAPATCACSGRDTITQNPRIHAKSTRLAVFGFMLVLLIHRCQSTSTISTQPEKLRTLSIFGLNHVVWRECLCLRLGFSRNPILKGNERRQNCIRSGPRRKGPILCPTGSNAPNPPYHRHATGLPLN